MDYTYFELKSKKKATVTRKYAITILNSKGDKHGQFREGYNDFRKIKSIKGFIYDKDGKQIKKIKKKEINDVSAVSGGDINFRFTNKIYRGSSKQLSFHRRI